MRLRWYELRMERLERVKAAIQRQLSVDELLREVGQGAERDHSGPGRVNEPGKP
ncbi:MAG: hypothetical protein JO101_10060 [Candidatus Eremiobacteraeota bacterium]|nr:hypothetical protein [Candidatus Eremiobacteraeota bacterium]MBV8355654.1 hypothetical protein [Candidatus Eremiobacteraeota bacterium]